MSNIISSIYKRICERRARIKEAQRNADTLRMLAEKNPTCKVMTIALTDVVMGEYVAIIPGAVLNKVNISDFSYISNDSVINNVDIGKFCSIGPHVQIGLAPHPSRVFVSTYPAFYSNFNGGCPMNFREDKIFDDSVPKTKISNDVWIGSHVIIPGGISIGTGAIVAAGAVVVKNVPPYAVVGGNPAKVIRYRFSEAQMEVLLASKWWDWPTEKICRNLDEFADIEKFKEIID